MGKLLFLQILYDLLADFHLHKRSLWLLRFLRLLRLLRFLRFLNVSVISPLILKINPTVPIFMFDRLKGGGLCVFVGVAGGGNEMWI